MYDVRLDTRFDHTERAARREQVVYETYDLLTDSENIQFRGNTISLKFPSDVNNLARIKVRAFLPKKLPLIENYSSASNVCVLKPYIYMWTGTNLRDVYAPTYQLYSMTDDGVLAPINESFRFTVPFVDARDFVNEINNAVSSTLSRFKKFAFGYVTEATASASSTAHVSTGTVSTSQLVEVVYASPQPNDVIIRPVTLTGELGTFILTWILDTRVSPYDFTHMSEYTVINQFVTRYTAAPSQSYYQLANVWERSDDWETVYGKFVGASDNYYLILASPYMKNLSHIVYIEGYGPSVDYKEMSVSATQQVIQLRLLDREQNILTRDQVANVYSNIWVSIDYVYENYVN